MRVRVRLAVALIFLIAALCVSGCGSVKYVPVETEKIEYRENVRFERDSIFVCDSVYIREKGDTIWLERYHTLWKEKWRTDTIVELKEVTQDKIVEVEKKLTRWQQIKQDFGAIAIGGFALLILAVGAGIIKKFKR